MNEIMDVSFYNEVKSILENSRNQVYTVANSAMVNAYWSIGKVIVEKQGGEERAEYGSQLIKELSVQLTRDFGKGFTERNLQAMRQFYLTFQNPHTLRADLTWSHYRTLIRVKSANARQLIAKYSVLNDGKQLFAAKYQFTLPTVEELQNYIVEERRRIEERNDIV